MFVNDGLTLDFDQILSRIRARGFEYRSTPGGPADRQVNHYGGGRHVYWSQPDEHVWEILTVSYARQDASK